MPNLKIDNKIITTPISTIVSDIRSIIHNGKLKAVKDRGANIRVTCPFHKGGQENKASADIYIGEEVDKLPYGWFKCFTCGEQGPFYHFVAACLEISDVAAKQWLLDNYESESEDLDVLALPPIELNKTVTKDSISEDVLSTFENFHPYMTQRKLSKRIIEVFEVKYDPKTNCIVFPVRDEHGKLHMFTRRSVQNKTFIIDKSKEKPLYLLYYMLQHDIDNVMITEGQIDALTACSYGFPCVATMGAISDHQIDLINNSGIRVLYTMFDNDAAGYRFTQKLLRNLRKDILTINVPIIYQNKKDINDLTQAEFENCVNLAERSF